MSIFWVYLISTQLVTILQLFALIYDVNESKLGLSIFAIGNSMTDLLTNIAIARIGMPVMAIGASFGAPMLNILLGIGVSILFSILQSDPSSSAPLQTSIWTRYYDFGSIPMSLYRSLFALQFALVFTFLYIVRNKFIADASLGYFLLSGYFIFTFVNILL